MSFLDTGRRIAGLDGRGALSRSDALYILSCVALLSIAAMLRFGGLSDDALWYDEYTAAENAGYTISHLIDRTRDSNSTPLLYPFILYFVQKFDVSAFSLRIVPATASFLTVAALLFLLPRVGVDRVAAFVAASLATVSVNAINHAQDVREYSIDSLVAVLMIAGLLTWLRDGRKRLFCASLVVAPLLQYNLVLFGIAVFATAIVMRWISLSKAEDKPGNGWAGGVARLCRELLLPGVCFLLACGVSALTTVRYQWEKGFDELLEGSYLRPYHYMGEYRDLPSLLEFVFSATYKFLKYSLPNGVVETAAVLVGAVFVFALVRRRRVSTLPILFAFSLTIAISAAVARYYPFGGIRMALYLLPILYLAIGCSVRAISEGMPAAGRTGAAALVGVVVLSLGARDVAIRGNFVETLSSDPDLVYVDSGEERAQQRHGERIWTLIKGEDGNSIDVVLSADGGSDMRASLYWRMVKQPEERVAWDRRVVCFPQATNIAKCLEQYARDFFPGSPQPLHDRIEALLLVAGVKKEEYLDEEERGAGILANLTEWTWLDDPEKRWENSVSSLPWRVSPYDSLLSEHANPDALDVELVYPDRNTDMSDMRNLHLSLYRIENFHRFYEPVLDRVMRVGESDRLLIRSSFDVYLREGGKIVYVKEPCVDEETRHPFYLHIFPRDAESVPEDRREQGFDSRDFPFVWYGARYEGRCVIEVDLPDYDIARIRAGQYVRLGLDNAMYFNLWSGEAELSDLDIPGRDRQ